MGVLATFWGNRVGTYWRWAPIRLITVGRLVLREGLSVKMGLHIMKGISIKCYQRPLVKHMKILKPKKLSLLNPCYGTEYSNLSLKTHLGDHPACKTAITRISSS